MESLLIALGATSLVVGLSVWAWRRRRNAALDSASAYLGAEQLHHHGAWHIPSDHCDSASSAGGADAGCGDAGGI